MDAPVLVSSLMTVIAAEVSYTFLSVSRVNIAESPVTHSIALYSCVVCFGRLSVLTWSQYLPVERPVGMKNVWFATVLA